MTQKQTVVDWALYGFCSVGGQICLWGLTWLTVWFGWDIALVNWLKVDHFFGRERDFVYSVTRVLTALHILITIGLLFLELMLGRQRVK